MSSVIIPPTNNENRLHKLYIRIFSYFFKKLGGIIIPRNKLFYAILGEQDSGKSETWNSLFDAERTATGTNLRELSLNDYINTDVFLFSGSPQERGLNINTFRNEFQTRCIDNDAKIVLCSLQTYSENTVIDAIQVLRIAEENGYEIFIQWLYQGRKSSKSEQLHKDTVNDKIIEMMKMEHVIGISNVNTNDIEKNERAVMIKTFILGWILSR